MTWKVYGESATFLDFTGRSAGNVNGSTGTPTIMGHSCAAQNAAAKTRER